MHVPQGTSGRGGNCDEGERSSSRTQTPPSRRSRPHSAAEPVQRPIFSNRASWGRAAIQKTAENVLVEAGEPVGRGESRSGSAATRSPASWRANLIAGAVNVTIHSRKQTSAPISGTQTPLHHLSRPCGHCRMSSPQNSCPGLVLQLSSRLGTVLRPQPLAFE